MKKLDKGFTLLEMLVVVLIVGILAAFVLPQYRIAIKKTELAGYVNMANILRNAEEAYYLANEHYVKDLTALNISLPDGCTYTSTQYCSFYECGKDKYGICNDESNVQVGTIAGSKAGENKLRYLIFLKKIKNMDSSGVTYYRGDHVCMARAPEERKACMSLGPYEITSASATEVRYRYKKWFIQF